MRIMVHTGIDPGLSYHTCRSIEEASFLVFLHLSFMNFFTKRNSETLKPVSMITYVKGDIFDSQAFALVNPVNCDGVMGKGLAKQFRETFKANHKSYRIECRLGLLKPGGVVMEYDQRNGTIQLIINVATKDHWKQPSELNWIINGILEIRRILREIDIPSVAIPALGCGNGGLSWDRVKEAIEDHLSDVECNIEVYIPRK